MNPEPSASKVGSKLGPDSLEGSNLSVDVAVVGVELLVLRRVEPDQVDHFSKGCASNKERYEEASGARGRA